MTERREFFEKAAGLLVPAGAARLVGVPDPQVAPAAPGSAVNVRDFGAVGDGVTDNAAAIQSAVAAAANKILLFPPARLPYRVASMVTIDNPVTIEGAGASVFFDFPVDTPNARGALFEIRSSRVWLHGLTIDGTSARGTIRDVNRYAVRVDPRGGTRYADVRVTGCAFTNLTQHSGPVPATATVVHAVYFRQLDDALVRDCVFDNLSGACVALFDTQRATIESNRCSKFGWSGVWLNNANAHTAIRNNTFTGTTAASPSYWGGAIDVMGQTADAAAPGLPDRDVLVEGNRFVGGVYRYGQVVRLASTQGAVIRGNTFYQCDADQSDAPGHGPKGSENNCITLSVRDVTRNNGPHRNISIVDNLFFALGEGWQKAIFVTTSAMTPAVNADPAEGLIIHGNQFICPDARNYFLAHLSLHGRRAGYRSIVFGNNIGQAVPNATPNYVPASVPAAVAIIADPGHAVSGVTVTGNHLALFGRQGTTNNDCAVHITAGITHALVEHNVFTNFARAVIVDPANAGDVPLPARNLYDQPRGAPYPVAHRGVSAAPANGAALVASAPVAPAGIAAGAGLTVTVPLTGAATGDFVLAAFTQDLQGLSLSAWVSAANTVSARFQNETGRSFNLPSGEIRVRVTKMS